MKKLIGSLLLSGILFYSSPARAADDSTGKKLLNSNQVSVINFSTRVYFSNDIPVAGRAKADKEFVIKPEGGYVYLIVDNYPDNFTYDQLQVKVNKTINGSSQLFDNKTYTISTDNYFTYIKYSFFSTGSYVFDVYTKYGTFLGSSGVTISNDASTVVTDDCAGASYKQYYNPALKFSMCIPRDSYVTESTDGDDKMTVNNFYNKKLGISFMSNPDEGIDKFDASVIELARNMDAIKSSYSSFYRKEFKLLSSKGDITIYRSVREGTLKSSGSTVQQSAFYIRMNGNKIKDHDYMLISGVFVDASDDGLYQIIIELGMLSKLRVY